MTISTTTRTKQYNGDNSTTVFAYDFNIQADSELEVYLGTPVGAPTTWTKKTLTTHYTVSGAGTAGGGNVTFTSGNTPPTGTGNIFIRRVTPKTQSTDYVENDPFPANAQENALDKITQITQDMQEEIDRCFKLGSIVPDAGVTEASSVVADRANMLFAFDADGDFSVTQEIGTFQGNWAASTAYVVRDLVKDTSNNNIYICLTAHTSSGSQPISTNTDSAKWSLIVDAASATTSASAAASSATAAASSATAAASSASAASTSESNASTSASTASTQASNASTSASNASTSETNAATSATNAAADAVSTAADAVSTAADAVSTAADVVSSGTNATTATTQASNASTSASNAATSETNAASSASSASTSASTATTQASNASTSATSAATSAAAAAASADSFDDVYLGAKSSDPSVDNDGDALNAGDWYFNTTSNISRMYDGSSFNDVSVSSASTVTKTSATGSAILPSGTTLQRDGSPVAGYLRWNSSDTTTEVYDGSAWSGVGGGGPSLGTDSVIRTNAKTISENITFAGTENGSSVGPISVASGYTVTVTSGSTWTII